MYGIEYKTWGKYTNNLWILKKVSKNMKEKI